MFDLQSCEDNALAGWGSFEGEAAARLVPLSIVYNDDLDERPNECPKAGFDPKMVCGHSTDLGIPRCSGPTAQTSDISSGPLAVRLSAAKACVTSLAVPAVIYVSLSRAWSSRSGLTWRRYSGPHGTADSRIDRSSKSSSGSSWR